MDQSKSFARNSVHRSNMNINNLNNLILSVAKKPKQYRKKADIIIVEHNKKVKRKQNSVINGQNQNDKENLFGELNEKNERKNQIK